MYECIKDLLRYRFNNAIYTFREGDIVPLTEVVRRNPNHFQFIMNSIDTLNIPNLNSSDDREVDVVIEIEDTAVEGEVFLDLGGKKVRL